MCHTSLCSQSLMQNVSFFSSFYDVMSTNNDFCICKGTLMKAETTPAKSQTTESLGGLISPQVAACAPSGAALPSPSITTSPIPSQLAVRHQRTPSSLKQWLSQTHGSPSQICPPLRQVLSPNPQSLEGSTSPSERRAKRRLETGDVAADNCEDAERCDCVTALYPAAKRSRALSGFCCSTQESQGHTDCHTEDEIQSSKRQTGKENFSPRAKDWLSVMAQKMRKSHTSSITPRSPTVSKKQEGKIPASPVSTLVENPMVPFLSQKQKKMSPHTFVFSFIYHYWNNASSRWSSSCKGCVQVAFVSCIDLNR